MLIYKVVECKSSFNRLNVDNYFKVFPNFYFMVLDQFQVTYLQVIFCNL